MSRSTNARTLVAGEAAAFDPVTGLAPVLSTPNNWLAWPTRNTRAQLRLFCFAYAGGSGTLFRSWRSELPEAVDVCAIQMPGRGARMRERSHGQMSALIPPMAEAILPLCDRPFAFFGHSLGALISFELTRKIRRQTGREPSLLVVSGRRAPQLPSTQAPIHDLPHDAFINELRRLRGTPDEILLNHELMELLVPALRADFELCDTYQYSPAEPLTVPMVVYGGLDDEDDTPPKLEAWRAMTKGSFSLRMFPGGHFFIHTAESLLLRSLSAELRTTLTTLD